MKYDVIIIGGGKGDALIGLNALKAGKTCLLICEGRISEDKSREDFRKHGGTLLFGDKIKEVKWSPSMQEIECVYTQNLEDTKLESDCFILCSGRFFTKGLVSNRFGVYESVFGVDVKYLEDRALWCVEDFFSEQPFESFGVIVNPEWKAFKNNLVISNLYVAGEILCDKQNNIEEICKIFKTA